MTDYDIFGELTGPTNVATDDASYTMGLEFDVDETCWLIAIEFWQGSGNSPSSSTRQALLYEVVDESSGVLIFGPEDFPATVEGWNAYEPDDAPQIDPGDVFRACVFHPAGRYSATANYFSSGDGADPITVGPVRVMDADLATGGHQCSFTENATPQFPVTSFNSTFYWINIVLTDVDPNTPVVTSGMSISDTARANMLEALELTADQGKLYSNVDLMRQVVAAGGLSLITVTTESAAKHYERYLRIVRDS